jgi:hypothetical protein
MAIPAIQSNAGSSIEGDIDWFAGAENDDKVFRLHFVLREDQRWWGFCT